MMHKKQVFEQMLQRQPIVCVYINPRVPGIELPDNLLQNVHPISLEYGMDLPIPIRDFRIEENGVYAVLSFGGAPHHTFVPWDAVFGITDRNFQQGKIWGEEIPPMVEQRAVAQQQRTADRPHVASARRAHLRLVK